MIEISYKTFLFLFCSVSVLMISCASFKRSVVKNDKHKLTNETLDSLNANYSFYYYKKSLRKDDFQYPNNNNSNTLLNSLNRTYHDSLKLAYCNCSFKDKKTLIVKCYNVKDSCASEQTFEGKLKSNGFFHLNNQYLKRNRIPLLYGGIHHSKTRIGLTNENEIIVQTAHDHWGSVLIFLGSGINYNTVHYFSRQ